MTDRLPMVRSCTAACIMKCKLQQKEDGSFYDKDTVVDEVTLLVGPLTYEELEAAYETWEVKA